MTRRSRLVALLSDRTTLAVLVVALLALVARLVFLGHRVAHQDEARVGYWMLRFLVNGQYEYRPIVHGPFLFVVNRTLFALLGPSDFVARLPVALLGSALPLSALLFRQRLKRGETVALSLLLAANPVLLYYSRFVREDLPLAAFMLFAVGFWVRAYDAEGTRWLPYFFAGVTAFGLAFTTKENALLYPVCWAGALVILVDHRLFRAWAEGESPVDRLGDLLRSLRSTAEDKLAVADDRDLDPATLRVLGVVPLIGGLLWWLTVVVFFYAPRGGGYAAPAGTADGAGLWEAILGVDPVMFAAVVEEATYGTWVAFYGTWAAGGHQEHAYLPFLGDFLRTLGEGAAVLSLLALVGFVIDRYADDGPRDLVAFAAYWGFFSVLGYPLVTDIAAPWTTIHAIVPLAIPAAVAAGKLYRTGTEALADDDAVSVGIAAVIALVLVGWAGYGAVANVYLAPQGPNNELVQYAQSSSTDMKPVLDDIEQVGYENQGTDVLFYGDEWSSPDESEHDVPHAGAGWFQRLPLMWYFEVYEYRAANDGDPSTEFVINSTDRERVVAEDTPPVVAAFANVEGGTVPQNERDVRRFLDGYSRYQGHRFQFDSGTQSSIAIYVDTDRLQRPADVYDGVVREGRVGRVGTTRGFPEPVATG